MPLPHAERPASGIYSRRARGYPAGMQRPDPHTIPTAPGVYIYRDARGRVLYVGKARILRRRVLSYFRADVPDKTAAMLARARSLEHLTTGTEKEALLLEASLIRKHHPPYNILLRDDKRYALFRLDVGKEFPRLEMARRARRDGARYFGPFTSPKAARETWKLLHRVFALRRCSDRAMRNRVRPCLYHHMGQCPAPCTGLADAAEYRKTVGRVVRLLDGGSGELVARLRTEMEAASDALEFERAAQLRDWIRAVEHATERQAVVLPGGGDMDVAGVFPGGNGLALGVVFVRGGAVLDIRTFWWAGLTADEADDLLRAFLAQFYADAMPPPRILLPWPLRDGRNGAGEDADNDDGPEYDGDLLEEALAERRGGPVRIVGPQNDTDRRLVEMARANAREADRRETRDEPSIMERLARALHLDEPPVRIECVDVSHTGGRQTRVGMTVFENGRPLPSAWRTYAMPDGNDDCGNLHAWTLRRLEGGPPWPDLLLVDGGRGQIAAVGRAMAEADRKGLFALAGIAKARDEHGHADRRAGNVADRIFLPGRINPLPLREGGPELLFLQHVRDETHRFAIGRHRRARGSAALSGELLNLPGIGPATARLLWDRFGSLEAMRAADLEQLRSIPGIGERRARAILARLREA